MTDRTEKVTLDDRHYPKDSFRGAVQYFGQFRGPDLYPVVLGVVALAGLKFAIWITAMCVTGIVALGIANSPIARYAKAAKKFSTNKKATKPRSFARRLGPLGKSSE